MKRKIFFGITSFMLFSNVAVSQFIVKDVYFETTGVSNQGIVAGYTDWAGPYSLWTPENQQVEVIGGIAPGNGVGGQATFSVDGNFLSGTSQGAVSAEMSRYNVNLNTWQICGSLGFPIDNSFSGGYAISGDGNTVVGNAWADTTGGLAYAKSVAWTSGTGIIDLGTLFPGRSTRANAINGDGSIIVGWQDFNGPWKSAVWRKDGQGNYLANQYLLKDQLGSASDEFNQLGECSAISLDGNWIGGHGDFATDGNPWLWSESDGYVDLGTLSAGAAGYVAAINENGTKAIGRFQVGPWDPELPFIWTEADGMQNLNDYATNVLGIDLGNKQIYSANGMSPNGQYIVGYGVDNVTFEYFTYRLSLPGLGLEKKQTMEIAVSPNPTKDHVNISVEGKVEFQLKDITGKILKSGQFFNTYDLNMSTLEIGTYILSVMNSENGLNTKPIKLIKE